ncbi:MAG TPA: hypothetical protein VMM58_05715 [Bacteroidota bacterium]|nr:hypothetical protein [Bacteroidota bacterium]
MELQMLCIFGLAAGIALLLTPLVIRFATLVGAIDLPNERKIHRYPIPRLGGIALCIGFLVTLFVLKALNIAGNSPFPFAGYRGLAFIAAFVLIFFVGVVDDIRSINPGKKFLVQLAAAAIVYAGGFRISSMTNFLSPGKLNLGILDFPLTVIWIAGVTNAFNLIDGLDGLASGVGIIASLCMSCIAYLKGDIATAFIVLALAGAIAGFLRYNFHPAKIFLGDSGSLLIGFTLAVLSIRTSTKGTTAFAVVVPILALGLPVMDTILSMFRRLLYSLLPEHKNGGSFLSKLHSMFLPDKRHIHHQLMALGLSYQGVVITLYVVSAVLGLGALAVTVSNDASGSLVLLVVGLALVAGIRQLRYKEMAVLSNGIFLPMYQWPVVQRAVFQGFADLGFSIVAFLLSYALASGSDAPFHLRVLFPSVLAVGGVQLAVFTLCGMYKSSFRYAGIGEALKIAKASLLSVAAASLVLWGMALRTDITLTTILTDFYLFVSLVTASRISFQVFNFFFERDHKNGRKVLIYGARANGILTLQHILHNEYLGLTPVGFLDDDPSLEGKDISGYRVFGGHWKLRRLLWLRKVDEIVIAADTMQPEILHRISRLAQESKTLIRKRKIFFEELPAESNAASGNRRAFVPGEKLTVDA